MIMSKEEEARAKTEETPQVQNKFTCQSCDRQYPVRPGDGDCTHSCMCGASISRVYDEEKDGQKWRIHACPRCYERFGAEQIPGGVVMTPPKKKESETGIDPLGPANVLDGQTVVARSPRLYGN